MPRKNKYINRSRVAEAKFRDLVKFFSLDLSAQQIAILTKLNRNTVNRYLKLIRKRIAELCESETPYRSTSTRLTGSTTLPPRRTKTAASPFTSAVTPRRTISCPSSRAGITSSGCINRRKRSWMEPGHSRIRKPLSEVWSLF